ncbi:hypothetical protein [Spirosoma oryzicola]|uniref:hypothetical protein n=1 Tax=Spirosoma oryzicola TaxID=2898794 RepID=UPI001E419E79|nr:hypothetical protein [Spirosoma oryzicola]UHG91472.1 hypothetical protein LQ777_00905 [Spirosoma oryzicola]
MKKTSFTAFLSAIAVIGLLMGCSGSKTPPVSERIAKVWTASKIEWNNVTVYTKGATSNVRPGYANYQLNLSAAPTVTFTDFEGTSFTGQYSVPSDTQLSFSNISPPISGNTTGKLDFTINSISDNELVITQTTTTQKTGGQIVKYTLTNP